MATTLSESDSRAAALSASAARGELAVPLALVALVFFTSGVPALIYQLVWQRLLALHSGVGIYSVAMIVAAFMAGLGLGAFVGGLLSARLSHAGALRAFAAVELGIAAFAAASVWLYYDVLYLQASWLYANSWSVALCHFLALLPPTALMGMSLPLLVRAMVTDPASAPRQIGLLYGVNGLGAALGAVITPWFLMRHWGVVGAVQFGVWLNVAAGLGALVLGIAFARRTRPTPTVGVPLASNESRLPLSAWALLYATSGFCALGLEIVWFRLIDTAVKSTAFTFGTVLGMYLLGLSIGSLIGALIAPRLRRPLEAFLACQAMLAVYTVALVSLLAYLPPSAPGPRWFIGYWGQSQPFVPINFVDRASDQAILVRHYVVLPLLVLAVPTMLMGLSFAVLQRAVQDDEQSSGRKVGLLQAANIAGSTAGSLVVGLALLEWFGTAGTLRVLTLLGAGFALLGLRSPAWRPAFGAVAAFLLAAVWFLPGNQSLWLPLHGLRAGAPAYFAEDASAIVALKHDKESAMWVMYVNGKSHSQLPYKKSPFEGTHVLLGALPSLIHPAPRDVAVIGLGSGATAWAAGFRPDIERLDVFEICSPEQTLIRQAAEEQKFPDMQEFLADRRVHVKIIDGRNGVAASDKKYDIIEADATRPSTAYSGHLYSREFFRQCARQLKPGGLMCTWAPTARTYVTFCEVFPHVVAVRDDILIGSQEPIAIELAAWLARLHDKSTVDYLGATNARYVINALQMVQYACPAVFAGVIPNDDLFPYDELSYPDDHTQAFELIKLIVVANQYNHPEIAAQHRVRLRQLMPELPFAHWIEGRSLANEGKIDDACIELDKALAAAPCYAEARLDRAILAGLRGDTADAEKQYQQVVQLLPGYALGRYELGQFAAQRNDHHAAQEQFRQALTLDDECWQAQAALAKNLLDSQPTPDQLEEAARLARQASVATNRREIVVEETLAAAFLAAGRKDDARKVLERLVSLCEELDDRPAAQRARAQLATLRQSEPTP